ncbi:xylose isomerase-like protein [Aspergillus karnatakaensis]|uniref:sugar phosphate isomerase/epimerase family protein n=1 Tax=Aspergillus karnatakaensis TaxID=1810916 RepID=UPI003CCCC4D1
MPTLSNPIAIGTSCLGQSPTHTLDQKIQAAAPKGFQGFEIIYADLSRYSISNNISIITGAKQIRQLADDLGVAIISLAPFENFEGSTSSPIGDRLALASQWLDLARILGASYLQIPSQYNANESTGDESVIVSEMQQLSDLAASLSPVISIAYEPLSWGVYCSTWEEALALVQKVDRDNFGLCLDTFHEITKLWASPFAPSGVYPDGPEKLASSLSRSIEGIPLEKIFYVQLSDAERFDPPFSENHPWFLEGEAPEFTWSRHARPFPLESEFGGYTPVVDVVRAWVVEKGFKGWISMEIFDRRMRDEAYKVEDAAERGWRSWERVNEALEGKENARV